MSTASENFVSALRSVIFSEESDASASLTREQLFQLIGSECRQGITQASVTAWAISKSAAASCAVDGLLSRHLSTGQSREASNAPYATAVRWHTPSGHVQISGPSTT